MLNEFGKLGDPDTLKEVNEVKAISKILSGGLLSVELPDISFIELSSRFELMGQDSIDEGDQENLEKIAKMESAIVGAVEAIGTAGTAGIEALSAVVAGAAGAAPLGAAGVGAAAIETTGVGVAAALETTGAGVAAVETAGAAAIETTGVGVAAVETAGAAALETTGAGTASLEFAGTESAALKTTETSAATLKTAEVGSAKAADVLEVTESLNLNPEISEAVSDTSKLEGSETTVTASEGVEKTNSSELEEIKSEGSIEEAEPKQIEESRWSDEINENIHSREQYEILDNAGLTETEINDKTCLIKENINLEYTDEDGISNLDRIERGLSPLDPETGKPLELHHLGQKIDSPLVELTEAEHRTGEYIDGIKNHSLWHNNNIVSEVHGPGNNWDLERKSHWLARYEILKGE